MNRGDGRKLSISVIIPTYNRISFIAAAVESALRQTRQPDEIIVVDDGSTDGTDRILSQFGPPAMVIPQPNRGRSAARNAGLRAATSDVVIFLDSDDTLMPDCLENCARVLEEQPDVGVVYTDAFLVDPERNPICLYSQALPGRRPSGMVLGELARRNFITISSMVRRSCLDDITFDERLECAEDYDFWRRLAVRCRFHYLDLPLMCYRFHEAMTVSSGLTKSLAAELEVQQRIMDMPEFRQLNRRARSRTYCAHGIKRAMLGATSVARTNFWRAIRTSPSCASAYMLWLLSLVGARPLQFAILKRRQLAGNRLGTMSGPNIVQPKLAATCRAAVGDNRTRAIADVETKLPIELAS